MIDSIWRDVKFKYYNGDITTRLIVINCAVFVGINLVNLLSWSMGATFFDDLVRWLSFDSNGWFNLTHPWVFFTNYLLHVQFMHLLGNMLMLSIAGIAAMDTFGNKRLLSVYILGGLAGNLIYSLVASLVPSLPLGDYMLGASASIMAVLLAAATTQPEYRINLFIIGPVPLKYLSLALIFLDLISIPGGGNTGGHLAHLAGAFIGFSIAKMWFRGVDMTKPVNRFLKYLVGLWTQFTKSRPSQDARPRPEKVYQATANNRQAAANKRTTSDEEQAVLDTILDKIKQSGYDSLSAEERETLFSASRK